MQKPSVLIVHNQMAPYRVPIFNSLNDVCDLEVLFCYERGEGRVWTVVNQDCRFRLKILWDLAIRVKGRLVYANPGIVPRILFGRADVVVLTLGPDIIMTIYLAYLCCRIRRRPCVLWLAHHRDRRYKPRSLFEKVFYRAYRHMEKGFILNAQSVLAYGLTTREYAIEDMGKNENDVFVGSQVWPLNPVPPDHDFGERPLRFLYVGYLVKGKRVQDLIEAFGELKGDDVELVIAGDGPERKALEESCRGDRRIRFTGYVEGADKERLLSRAHVFVTPSDHDTLPNAVIEAMGHGLPLIATEECHCPEWFDGNALTFAAGDRESLRNHLMFAHGNRLALRRMSLRSRELAEQYDIPFAVNAFRSAIGNALKGNDR